MSIARPSATPLREGMGCRITLIINGALLRHPLSERGARSAGCVALSSIYIPPGGRTIKHRQSWGVSHCQINYPLNPVNPWSCYRVALLKILKKLFQNYSNPPQRGQSPAEMPFLHSINFGRCPIVVRSLSVCCPVIDWTTTGQQLDNDWTTSEGGLVICWQ